MIHIEDVSKRFGNVQALADLSFEVRDGTVVGFLGPNGAGKSTCLRVLLGLVRPDCGLATIEGRRHAELDNPAGTVGSLIAPEAFHPGRTGLETVLLAALAMKLSRTRVEECLAEVGLSEAEGKKRVGQYSLGMRLRLGIAIALLADPRVLILDEPTNGLDPQGQRWLSELLSARARRGGCVLLSSHNLHEVAKVADQVVIVGAGRVVSSTTMQGLDLKCLEAEYFKLTSDYDRSGGGRY